MIFSRKASNNIGLRIIRQGNEGIHITEAFLRQEAKVAKVAIDDQGIGQFVGEALTTIPVFSYQCYIVVIFQQLGCRPT